MFDTITAAYRAAAFGTAGLFDFTRQGFARNARGFAAADQRELAAPGSLRGRLAIVTGANAGIGRQVALELARRGAHVRMVCRDGGRGAAARDEVARLASEGADGGDGNNGSGSGGSNSSQAEVHCDVVDVSRPREVRDYVRRLEAEAPGGGPLQVHVLVNNAAVLPATRSETADGLETTFATNALGAFYLTELLMPALERAELKSS
ncbi:Dehydrogenase/reductase SDR member 12 [Cladochytrium tenue]|nr:Dehydrogenase/reductase SDR member 12 [Cladochytrium tenue]